MQIDAVIFDWGGTLVPWATIDYREEWASFARVVAPDDAEATAGALLAAASQAWERSRDEHTSATFDSILRRAGVEPSTAGTEAYRAFWEPATFTDPEVGPLFERIRVNGTKVGVLSNTVWPRAWHEEFFERDGVAGLIDGDVYTSDIDRTKPHPEAFAAAMNAVGVDDPQACVFVGDRLFDDIWGAASFGMRTIHVPHSSIPEDQIGHSIGEPDAVVEHLSQVADVIEGWRERH